MSKSGKIILAKDNTPAPAFPPVQMEFKVQRIADLLCSALEGGSDYWCRIEEKIAPPEENLRCHMNIGGDSREVFPHIDYPLCIGGAIVLRDRESVGDCGVKTYRLNREAIERGLKIFATSDDQDIVYHFANWRKENDDAGTGDVFLQLCLFGEVKYG